MFLNFGFKSVTMDDIASEMGISKKTIYAHFETKAGLVDASTQYLFDEITDGIGELQKEKLNPILESYRMKEYVQKMLKNEKTSPQFQLKKYYPKLYKHFRNKQFEVTQRFLTENLERGINSGHYRSDIPLSFISRMHFVGMLGIKDKNLFPEDEYSNPKLMGYFLEYHLRAISTPTGLKTLQSLIAKYEENHEE